MTDFPSTDPRRYVKIAAMFRQQIADRGFQPGQPLPTLTATSSAMGCARATVAKAYQVLVDEDLVYRIRGLGYYVSGRPDRLAGD